MRVADIIKKITPKLEYVGSIQHLIRQKSKINSWRLWERRRGRDRSFTRWHDDTERVQVKLDGSHKELGELEEQDGGVCSIQAHQGS